jgi:hypothetical protein
MVEEDICKFCGRPLEKTHFNQKYHKECVPEVEREQTRNRVRRYRKRYKDVNKTGGKNGLGTGKLKAHRKKDFKEEAEDVRNELKRCKLR